MTAAMLTHQGLRQRPHRPIRAQHRIDQLEQRVCPPRQALIELLAEVGEVPEHTSGAGVVHSDQLKPLVVVVLLSQEE
jgi:hypothetical protein